MATAQKHEGRAIVAYVNGHAVDSEGERIEGAPAQPADTAPSQMAAASADPIQRLADTITSALGGRVSAAASVTTGGEVELPTLAALPDHLAGLTSVAAVQALQARDARKGAQAQYEARLADLAGA